MGMRRLSSPEQKCRPLPARTTHLIRSSSSAMPIFRAISSFMSGVRIELPFSGRFRVILAM